MLALIPARGGSKGLPGKNIRPLNGKPLIAYAIEAALGAKEIDRVIVSTDSDEIAAVSKEYGAEVPFMRPSDLARDDSLAIDNYIYTIDRLCRESGSPIENLAVLLPTAPLRNSMDIDGAIKLFREKSADSVVSYYPASHPVQWYRYIDENGVVQGVARVPLSEFYYPITRNTAVSPNGEVFALLPRPDSLDIIRLNFYQELEPLIPGAVVPQIIIRQ